jgi:hypothetical protein
MRMRNLAVALATIIAALAVSLGAASSASAVVQDTSAKQVAAKPVQHRSAQGSFSCEGKSFNYTNWFYLQGSGQRIGWMVGWSDGRYAVRTWRINGGTASFSISSLGTGGAVVVSGVYEHCVVRPSGATGANVWARISGVGTWSEDIHF